MTDRPARERIVLGGVAMSLLISAVAVGMLGSPAWVIAIVGVVVGWRLVPGFWRIVAYGLLGGALAGTVILGPGFRLAMRVVAVLDPVRSPEFTLEGTFFIVVFVGLLFGGILGAVAALLRHALAISGPAMATLETAAVLSLLLAGADLRAELLDLGAGGWMNIPMFGSVVFLYALAANRATDRLAARRAALATREPVEVQA